MAKCERENEIFRGTVGVFVGAAEGEEGGAVGVHAGGPLGVVLVADENFVRNGSDRRSKNL